MNYRTHDFDCYVDVYNHDVTNLQEFIIFVLLLVTILVLLWRNMNNFYQIRQVPQTEGARVLLVINVLISITLIMEFAQKFQQLICFVYNQTNDPKLNHIILQAKIYQCLTMSKFAFYYILILRTSFLWLRLIVNNNRIINFYNTYCDALFMLLSVVISIIYCSNIVMYLKCYHGILGSWRNIIVDLLTTSISLIFMFSVWIFYSSIRNESNIPQDFKRKVLILMVFFIISGFGRILWSFLLHYQQEWVQNLKNYSDESNSDIGYGWFFNLLIYQNLVNMLPLFSLIYIFTPQTYKKSQIEDNYGSYQLFQDSTKF
ncbi:hypothetical protein pb186bvf_006761 [Paramecium bursaria]